MRFRDTLRERYLEIALGTYFIGGGLINLAAYFMGSENIGDIGVGVLAPAFGIFILKKGIPHITRLQKSLCGDNLENIIHIDKVTDLVKVPDANGNDGE